MAETPYSSRFSFGLRLQVAFWIVFASFLLYLSTEILGWPRSLYRTLLLAGCHLFNFYGVYSVLIPRFYERRKYFHTAAGLLALIIVLTSARHYLEKTFSLNTFEQHFTQSGKLVFIIFTEVNIAAFAALLRLAVSHEQSKTRILELEKTELDTELRFLKSQMSPHFLFNAINNIYSLTLVKSDKASQALMKMSGLLRYLLYECHQKVTLHEEIEAMEIYASLFQLKYETPLAFKFQVDVKSPDGKVEPMLLIPLLENAFKHSGIGIIAGARVNISIIESSGSLSIKIENSVSAIPLTREPGGIGLPNIEKRLLLTYPGTHRFIVENIGNTFTAILEIPLQ